MMYKIMPYVYTYSDKQINLKDLWAVWYIVCVYEVRREGMVMWKWNEWRGGGGEFKNQSSWKVDNVNVLVY